MPDTMRRRAFLRLGLAGVGGAAVGALSACGAGSPRDARPDPTRGPRPARAGGPIVLAYFSRPGENYWNGGRRNLKVHPVTTYAMSGLGTTPEDYARECRGARIGTGLAVRGETARSAGADVDAWLRRAGLADRRARADG